MGNIHALEGRCARIRSGFSNVPGLHALLDKNSMLMGTVNVSGIQGKSTNWFDDLIV